MHLIKLSILGIINFLPKAGEILTNFSLGKFRFNLELEEKNESNNRNPF